MRRRPAQHRFHPGQQLPNAERLDDIVVAPQTQPLHAVSLLSPGGQDDHWQRRPHLAHGLEDVEAGRPGQHEVEQNQIHRGVKGAGKPVVASLAGDVEVEEAAQYLYEHGIPAYAYSTEIPVAVLGAKYQWARGAGLL